MHVQSTSFTARSFAKRQACYFSECPNRHPFTSDALDQLLARQLISPSVSFDATFPRDAHELKRRTVLPILNLSTLLGPGTASCKTLHTVVSAAAIFPCC